MVAPFLPDADKLAAVREALPAVGAGLYLDTPTAGPLPAETARAMADAETWELRTGRAGRDRGDEVRARIDEARAAAAALLGADLDDVALTHGLEDAIGRVIRTIDWHPGDRALVAAEDAATISSVLPRGVAAVAVDLPADGDAALRAVDEALAAPIRLVACPLVSAATGARLPVEGIVTRAHQTGAVAIVDVTQAAGTMAVDWRALGADAVVAGSGAWLLGPEGLAVVAGTPDRLGRPAAPDAQATVARFHLPSVVGFARSCGWLSMYVGLEWIATRSRQLADRARSGLRGIPGVEVITPPAAATVVVFRIEGWPADAVLDELGGRIFLLASRVPGTDAIRIGAGFFNTEAEIDRLLEGVSLLAAHGPDTLPPRRRLAVLGEDA